MSRMRVVLSLDINAAAWAEEYGQAPEEVREDIRRYITEVINQSWAGESEYIRVRSIK